jgi:2,4-dienoyl-CoA reductase (NADPH2)
LTPLNLGPHIGILPNRVLMGSMHTGLEHHSMPSFLVPLLGGGSTSKHHEHEAPLSRMATYFQRRAQGGVGLMVTGGIAPNMAGWTGPFSSQLTTEREMKEHQIVTAAVHSVQVPIVPQPPNDPGYIQHNPEQLTSVPARICLQILHTGRYAYHPFAVSASTTKSPISPFRAQGLSGAGIQRTIRDFVKTAVLAQQSGYDGVEIMGSEGYLLSQFLSPRTNHRTDDYGGASLQNRARLPLEIIQQVRQATGPEFIIIFRLSLLDLVDDGLLFSESIELASMVEQAGATIINTGIGWHEARVPTIATSVPRAAFAFTTKALKEANVVSIPLVATNRINHPATAESVLSDAADMVSMARPFLADPDFVQKTREGREDEINTCIGCNQACLDHVFVGKVASCLVNPLACHEADLVIQPLPAAERLRIGVVGAGPAGCAFAITAAQQGHAVTLFDKDVAIGGQFHMAKRIPGKEEFHETLRYFTTMLRKYNVNVQLQTEVTYEQMEQAKEFDKWIVATGVVPRDPQIPGQDHPNVLSYIDVLKHRKPIGKRVAVIGAGGIGFDVSEYVLHYSGQDLLAKDVVPDHFWKEWGIDPTMQHRGGLSPMKQTHDASERQIYLLQRKKGKLGAGLGKTTGWIHRATLNQSGQVEMLDNVKYERIDENGNLHILQNGKPRVLEVDNIIICAGQVEHRDLEREASKKDHSQMSSKVFTIGGAYAAGELDAKRAIDMGTRLALKIHEPNVVPGRHVFAAEVGVEEKIFKLVQRFMK